MQAPSRALHRLRHARGILAQHHCCHLCRGRQRRRRALLHSMRQRSVLCQLPGRRGSYRRLRYKAKSQARSTTSPDAGVSGVMFAHTHSTVYNSCLRPSSSARSCKYYCSVRADLLVGQLICRFSVLLWRNIQLRMQGDTGPRHLHSVSAVLSAALQSRWAW